MFFKNSVEKLDQAPDYLIQDAAAQCRDLKLVADNRLYFGRNTMGLRLINAPANVQQPIHNLNGYVLSQQHSILKNMITHEMGICSVRDGWPSRIEFPNRYINRIGEQIVIPLHGEFTVYNSDLKTTQILEAGGVYRFNGRSPNEIINSEPFMAVVLLLIDFDLRKHLLPHDLNSPFPRQKDEYFDPAKAVDAPEPVVAY